MSLVAGGSFPSRIYLFFRLYETLGQALTHFNSLFDPEKNGVKWTCKPDFVSKKVLVNDFRPDH